MNEWRSREHACAYLERADRIPHRAAGESTLLEEIPSSVRRVLDLGSGDGRLLDLVASATPYAHERFLEAMGTSPDDEDPSNKLLDVHTQLEWLRQLGFTDVDCYWKWRELALLVGRKRGGAA